MVRKTGKYEPWRFQRRVARVSTTKTRFCGSIINFWCFSQNVEFRCNCATCVPKWQKIPDYNDVSRIYRHLEKILKTRFTLIFESLGKSLKKWCFWESLGKSLLAIRFLLKWLPFHVSDVCKSHFLGVEKVRGVSQGPKLLISKKKNFVTLQNVTFWNRHDLPHMS